MGAEEHTQNAADVPDVDYVRDFSGAHESQGLHTATRDWEKQTMTKRS